MSCAVSSLTSRRWPWHMLAIFLLSLGRLPAQRADQLMQLMQSQPPVDLTSPVVATAVVDPPVVPVGDLAVYRITLNALEASVRWPVEIPQPNGLTLRQSSGGQILAMIANVQRPITARNYHVRVTRPGLYVIPAFEIEAYGKRVLVPEAQLEVSASAPAGYEPARRIQLQVATTNVFLGETIPVTVLVPGTTSNVVAALSQIQFNGDGVHGSKSPSRQLVEARIVNGRAISTVIYESSITPIAIGSLAVSAQGFTAGMFFTGPVVLSGQVAIQGFGAENVLLDSEPLHLNVQALPVISDQHGFTGFIGPVTVAPPQVVPQTLRVGDALRLLVTFWGDAAITRLIPPPAPRVPGWQIFPPTPADPPPGAVVTNFAVAFAYSLIPTTEEVNQTPAIPFHVFDPHRGAYVNLTIPPVPVTVNAEGLPENWLAEMAALDVESPVEDRPRLAELAPTPGLTLASLDPLQSRPTFLLIQFTPVAGLLLWWGYERRRRFLEAHPEIVRRRRARRALRRERKSLYHAARQQDAQGFARSAVAALQIVTAPRFPAESRAIVCGDVLGLLAEKDRTGPAAEVVRKAFARHDATNFSPSRCDGEPLFRWQPELDRVLTELEAGL